MIGPMIMGLVVTFLIVNFGWRVQFYAMGVLALILPLPMVWFLVRDRPAEHPAANAAEVSLVEAGSLENNEDAPGRFARAESRPWFSSIRFWLVTIAIAANNIMYWGWSIWLPTYLRTARGFSFAVSGYLTFVIYRLRGRDDPRLRAFVRQDIPSRAAGRCRMDFRRRLPDGLGAGADPGVGRRAVDLRSVLATGGHLVRGNADAQRRHRKGDGHVARRARHGHEHCSAPCRR